MYLSKKVEDFTLLSSRDGQSSLSNISLTLLLFRPTVHLLCLSVIIGMPNRSYILELKTNHCFVCNFLCMPRCKSQIAPKKTQCLSCFTRNFRNMLTPFQVVSARTKNCTLSLLHLLQKITCVSCVMSKMIAYSVL